MKRNLLLFFALTFLSSLYVTAQNYHEEDKEGLRQFLRQSETNLQLAGLTVVDTLSWKTTDTWINKLSGLGLTWNVDGRITQLYAIGKGYVGKLDCRKFVKLQKLECYNNALTDIDVTNSAELSWFVCQYNDLTSLDVSKNPNLSHFDCAYLDLKTIDVSNNPALNWFNCSGAGLTSLDITKNINIYYVFCHHNEIESIDISQNIKMRKLFCNDNKFKFSTLPTRRLTYYNYSPQSTIDGGEIMFSDIIDLSSEYNIENNITNYKWYDGDKEITSVSNIGNGKFIAGKENVGKTLICKMTNGYFPRNNWCPEYNYQCPDMVLEYKVIITGTKQKYLKNSLLFHKETGERLYSVSLNEEFNVYVSNTEARLGAYSIQDGHFIKDIVVAKNGNTYTCAFSGEVFNSENFIIQAYLPDDNKTVLSREPGSHIIDRLLLNVYDDWSFFRSAGSSNIDLLDHMKIKTSKENYMQVAVNVPFMVSLKTTNNSEDKINIGLFNWSDGSFVANLVLVVSGTTYKCEVPSYVLSGNYILAPYKEVQGSRKFIERPEDKGYFLDRYPLYVDNNMWSRSVVNEDVNRIGLGVYPNPVTDILNVNSLSDSIINIKLYDIGGRLIKTEYGKSTIAMGDLDKGVYLVVIETEEGVVTHKVNKY